MCSGLMRIGLTSFGLTSLELMGVAPSNVSIERLDFYVLLSHVFVMIWPPLATSSACSDFLHILDRASNLSILTLAPSTKENYS